MERRDCFSCGWNALGGNTLMGVCFWFLKNKGMAKEIPSHVCDKGCRFWTAEKQDFAELKRGAKVPAPIEETL